MRYLTVNSLTDVLSFSSIGLDRVTDADIEHVEGRLNNSAHVVLHAVTSREKLARQLNDTLTTRTYPRKSTKPEIFGGTRVSRPAFRVRRPQGHALGARRADCDFTYPGPFHGVQFAHECRIAIRLHHAFYEAGVHFADERIHLAVAVDERARVQVDFA